MTTDQTAAVDLLEGLARDCAGRAAMVDPNEDSPRLQFEARRLEEEADHIRLAAHALRNHDALVEALAELCDLIDSIREASYTPDSFTCQPARIALTNARKAP